ncbi:uncharacterized protein LOC129593069 isoform X2 [Paramacrobiotus metropolitanus]|uniref:uncharacterized protein LOC129593069 isoform X2 n=1 Tax=Paramacrobiotus metropolitanus TaxID=2943436 RepID=UPI002445DD92|nr:uncharacterized protein LOC129593069 isoform X2 [Paramacrobiotus metropolitanus]
MDKRDRLIYYSISRVYTCSNRDRCGDIFPLRKASGTNEKLDNDKSLDGDMEKFHTKICSGTLLAYYECNSCHFQKRGIDSVISHIRNKGHNLENHQNPAEFGEYLPLWGNIQVRFKAKDKVKDRLPLESIMVKRENEFLRWMKFTNIIYENEAYELRKDEDKAEELLDELEPYIECLACKKRLSYQRKNLVEHFTERDNNFVCLNPIEVERQDGVQSDHQLEAILEDRRAIQMKYQKELEQYTRDHENALNTRSSEATIAALEEWKEKAQENLDFATRKVNTLTKRIAYRHQDDPSVNATHVERQNDVLRLQSILEDRRAIQIQYQTELEKHKSDYEDSLQTDGPEETRAVFKERMKQAEAVFKERMKQTQKNLDFALGKVNTLEKTIAERHQNDPSVNATHKSSTSSGQDQIRRNSEMIIEGEQAIASLFSLETMCAECGFPLKPSSCPGTTEFLKNHDENMSYALMAHPDHKDLQCKAKTLRFDATCLVDGCPEVIRNITLNNFQDLASHLRVHSVKVPISEHKLISKAPAPFPNPVMSVARSPAKFTPSNRSTLPRELALSSDEERRRIPGTPTYQLAFSDLETKPTVLPFIHNQMAKEHIHLKCKEAFRYIPDPRNEKEAATAFRYGQFPLALVKTGELGEQVVHPKQKWRYIFVKRHEMQRLHRAIERKLNNPSEESSLLVCGSPGSGKTLACYASALDIFRSKDDITIVWIRLQKSETDARCVILWHSGESDYRAWNVKMFDFKSDSFEKLLNKEECLASNQSYPQRILLFVDGIRHKGELNIGGDSQGHMAELGKLFLLCKTWRKDDLANRRVIYVSSNFNSLLENQSDELEIFFYLSWTKEEVLRALEYKPFLSQVHGRILKGEYEPEDLNTVMPALRDSDYGNKLTRVKDKLEEQFYSTGYSARAAFLSHTKVLSELLSALSELNDRQSIAATERDENVTADERLHLFDRLYACYGKPDRDLPRDSSRRADIQMEHVSEYVRQELRLALTLTEINRMGRHVYATSPTLWWHWEQQKFSKTVEGQAQYQCHLGTSDLRWPKQEKPYSISDEKQQQGNIPQNKDNTPQDEGNTPKDDIYFSRENLLQAQNRYRNVFQQLRCAIRQNGKNGAGDYYLIPIKENHPGFDIVHIGIGENGRAVIHFADMTIIDYNKASKKDVDSKCKEICLFLKVMEQSYVLSENADISCIEHIELIYLAPGALVNRRNPIIIHVTTSVRIRTNAAFSQGEQLDAFQLSFAFSRWMNTQLRHYHPGFSPSWRLTRRFGDGFVCEEP